MLAPVQRLLPISDDTQLRANTTDLVRQAPEVVVASTGIGIRAWLEAAEGWGLTEPLHAALARAHLIARGAKARGALRAAGLVEAWAPESESGDEVLEHLLARGVAGQRVAVQLHGDDQPGLIAALREAGAEVVEVEVYRWGPPADLAPARRLVDLVLGGGVDAVTFTSAPAVEAFLRTAGADADAVLDALRGDVVAGCVGPVTAAPLLARDVPVVQPRRARMGALVHELVAELPRRAPTLPVAGRSVTLRGHAAVVDGELRPLAQAPMAVLRALAKAGGHVLSRAQLLTALPRGCDEHAVEMAVARLRTALGGPDFVQTVVKRGYRLRVDPS
jgi:uroporphyrinogen-III synthase